MGLNKKKNPIHEAKKDHEGPMYVQISCEKAITNLAKSSERTGLGYPEAQDPWDV